MPNTTTTPRKGLTQNEYNALLHALWRIDKDLKIDKLTETERFVLERDRQSLQGLFMSLGG
jgi:hypothetical protein